MMNSKSLLHGCWDFDFKTVRPLCNGLDDRSRRQQAATAACWRRLRSPKPLHKGPLNAPVAQERGYMPGFQLQQNYRGPCNGMPCTTPVRQSCGAEDLKA